jgi:hypothetical protein
MRPPGPADNIQHPHGNRDRRTPCLDGTAPGKATGRDRRLSKCCLTRSSPKPKRPATSPPSGRRCRTARRPIPRQPGRGAGADGCPRQTQLLIRTTHSARSTPAASHALPENAPATSRSTVLVGPHGTRATRTSRSSECGRTTPVLKGWPDLEHDRATGLISKPGHGAAVAAPGAKGAASRSRPARDRAGRCSPAFRLRRACCPDYGRVPLCAESSHPPASAFVLSASSEATSATATSRCRDLCGSRRTMPG